MRTISASLIMFVALSSNALAQQNNRPYYYDHMWGGWFMGPIMMLVFVALAAVIVILLVRYLGGSGHGPISQPHATDRNRPLDILKERFAKGEIDKDEFEERRKLLE